MMIVKDESSKSSRAVHIIPFEQNDVVAKRLEMKQDEGAGASPKGQLTDYKLCLNVGLPHG